MLIVADTGPLISLAVIRQLDLLDTLFYQVAIPEAVWNELESRIDELSIPEVRRFQNNVMRISHYQNINVNLGSGEKEAILLFEEIHADRLLIEDSDARLFAEARGIRCTGTLGILIEAKKKGIISVLRPLFSALLAGGRYFAVSLLNQILTANNEMDL
jgi:predicted nucleic acid-binding protein